MAAERTHCGRSGSTKVAAMHAIEFRDVCLTVGGRVILDAVSLDIGPREFVGVLGPNGSGKTTLMRAVLGLISPSRGTICVLGRPATRGNAAIGYLPQVRGSVAGMQLRGWDATHIGQGTPRDQAKDEPGTVRRIISHIPALAFTESRPA
jgi:ABC-type Mn2+/Zn2+ transport system ATPase subunit